MLDWDDAQVPAGNGESRDIERLKIDNGVKFRLIGSILPRYVYWVKKTDGKQFPIECLSFDRETTQFLTSEGIDPFKEVPDSAKDERAKKAQFAYVCNVIDRKDGKVKICDLKPTIFKAILAYAKNAEYGNPSHPEKGYDFTITKEKTGPLPINVKYGVISGRNATPLTDEEKAQEAFKLDVIFKRPTYDEQKRWLMENTSYLDALVPEDMRGDSESMQDI